MTVLLRNHIVVLALVTISGCASLVKPPHVTVISTNIVSVDTSGFDIELLAEVENPNPFDVSLRGYTYSVRVMSVPISGGGQQRVAVFPSGRLIDIRLPFRVNHTDLLEVFKHQPDLDRVPYSVDALLNLATPFGDVVIPVNKSDTVSVPAAYRPGTYFKRMLQPLREIP